VRTSEVWWYLITNGCLEGMTLATNRERVELSTFNPTIHHGSLSIPAYCSGCVDGVFGTLVPFSQTFDGHVCGRDHDVAE
jgi:hypothetical protein